MLSCTRQQALFDGKRSRIGEVTAIACVWLGGEAHETSTLPSIWNGVNRWRSIDQSTAAVEAVIETNTLVITAEQAISADFSHAHDGQYCIYVTHLQFLMTLVATILSLYTYV